MGYYTNEQNNKAYTQLNRLVIAKITSHPTEKTLYKIPTLTGLQILHCMRHINRLNTVE